MEGDNFDTSDSSMVHGVVTSISTMTYIAQEELESGELYANGSDTTAWVETSWNVTTTPAPAPGIPPPHWLAIIGTLLTLMSISTVLGNTLVCMAVGMVKRLRTPSNLLIVSLAISDLLVGLLVMPFALIYELLGQWVLGQALCDMWVSLDVLLCTASILNLCAISIDRYCAITRPLEYAMKRTPRRMALMIAIVWGMSALISITPLFVGWKTESSNGQCMVSQALEYQIYATLCAFYVPLTVMIVVYGKIFMVSARIAKAEAKSKIGVSSNLNIYSSSQYHTEENHNYTNGLKPPVRNNSSGDETMVEMIPKSPQNPHRRFTLKSLLSRNGRRYSGSRDSKATKTLGVIMGAFTACWLPFFILALVRPICGDSCKIPTIVTSIFLWLGYANSTLNPIIYARFNRDFRTPFREILCCRCVGINRRLRSESYNEQYGASAPKWGHRTPSYSCTPRNPSPGNTPRGLSYEGGNSSSLHPSPGLTPSGNGSHGSHDSTIQLSENGKASIKLGNGNCTSAHTISESKL